MPEQLESILLNQNRKSINILFFSISVEFQTAENIKNNGWIFKKRHGTEDRGGLKYTFL